MSYRKLMTCGVALVGAGMLGTSVAHASHGTGADPYVFTNVGGDNLWSNPDNWNQPEPPGPGHIAWINNTTDVAIINYAAPSIGELVIGQGEVNDGHVRMTTGGSITTSHVNLAWGSGRSGILEVDGGTMTVGQLRMGRGAGGLLATVNISGGTLTSSLVQLSSRIDDGVPAAADSVLNISGGTLISGAIHENGVQGTANIEIGHQGGNATMNITGGTVYGSSVLVANLGASSASGTLNITGGTLRALQIGVGGSSGTATNVGHLSIGGDAVVTTVNHIFLRPDGRGQFTVTGSDATITVNRLFSSGDTGFEVSNGSIVTFIADEGGFSPVNITTNTMRINPGDASVLNVDASPLGVGTYPLFTFAGGYRSGSQQFFGIENLTFADGLSGSVQYNPNSIQLVVIPEPGALSLLGLGGLAMIRRRRA